MLESVLLCAFTVVASTCIITKINRTTDTAFHIINLIDVYKDKLKFGENGSVKGRKLRCQVVCNASFTPP